MALSVEVLEKKVQKKLAKLSRDTGVSQGFISRDQMRLWLNGITKAAAPSNLAKGRGAIASDVSRLFEPIDNKSVILKWQTEAAKAGGDIFTTTKGGRVRISKKKLEVTNLSRMRRVHSQNRRKKDGRVFLRQRNRAEAWSGEFLVPENLYRKFIRQQQKGVGFLKSRFGKAARYYARKTRGTTPAFKGFIKRHSDGGTFSDKIDIFGNGTIKSTNDADAARNKLERATWWRREQAKRQRDVLTQSDKRQKDLARRFNSR